MSREFIDRCNKTKRCKNQPSLAISTYRMKWGLARLGWLGLSWSSFWVNFWKEISRKWERKYLTLQSYHSFWHGRKNETGLPNISSINQSIEPSSSGSKKSINQSSEPLIDSWDEGWSQSNNQASTQSRKPPIRKSWESKLIRTDIHSSPVKNSHSQSVKYSTHTTISKRTTRHPHSMHNYKAISILFLLFTPRTGKTPQQQQRVVRIRLVIRNNNIPYQANTPAVTMSRNFPKITAIKVLCNQQSSAFPFSATAAGNPRALTVILIELKKKFYNPNTARRRKRNVSRELRRHVVGWGGGKRTLCGKRQRITPLNSASPVKFYRSDPSH